MPSRKIDAWAIGTARWLFVPVAETNMDRVNMAGFYLLGARVHALFALKPDMQIVEALPLLADADEYLEMFLGVTVGPKAKESRPVAEELRKGLAEITVLPPVVSKMGVALNIAGKLGDKRASLIIELVKQFEAVLCSEMPSKDVFYVTAKRGYATEVLLSKAEEALSSDVIKNLVDFDIENIREAGRGLLFDRFTATGFHVMRAVESVARRYYFRITGRDSSGKMLGAIAAELSDYFEKQAAAKISTGLLGLVIGPLDQLCKLYRNPPAVIVLPLVVAERLFVEIAEEMERFNANVGAFQAALQKGPEVLDPVGMHIPAHVLFGVIHELMNVILIESGIGCQFVGEHLGACFNICAHFLLECAALAIRDMLHAHLASLTIQQAHYQFLARSTGARDLGLLVLVHVARESADESFVGFNLAFQLVPEGTGLHRKPDALEHEPSGLLRDAQIARDFVARNAVLAIRQQPDDGQPFVESDGRILEDGSDLGAELTPRMFDAALPASLIGEKRDSLATARRAFHAVRPANLDHHLQAHIGIGEVADRIDKRCGSSRFHAFNIAQIRVLVKYIIAQIRPEIEVFPCIFPVDQGIRPQRLVRSRLAHPHRSLWILRILGESFEKGASTAVPRGSRDQRTRRILRPATNAAPVSGPPFSWSQLTISRQNRWAHIESSRQDRVPVVVRSKGAGHRFVGRGR